MPKDHDTASAAILLKSTCAVCGAEIQYRSGMSLDFTMDFFDFTMSLDLQILIVAC